MKKITNVKNWVAVNYPEEFQLELINPDITFLEVWERMLNNEEFYELASVNGEGFDSEVRVEIFNGMCEVLGLDYDRVYNTWLHRGRK